MAHLVIGYPSLEESYKTARLFTEKNVEILELQIPFSHPTADGSIITQANVKAIEQHVTIEDSLGFIKRLKEEHPDQEIMVMTYLNKLFHYGIQNFCDKLTELNIKYLIVPDLNFDSPIAQPILQHQFVKYVPVIAANTSLQRLEETFVHDFDFYYIMSDFKITGSEFSLHENLKNIIRAIREKTNARVGIGFGISSSKHVQAVLKEADVAIVGSALVKATMENKLEEKLGELIR